MLFKKKKKIVYTVFWTDVFITQKMLVIVYNYKDTISIENVDMPLLLIIIMKKTKPKAHVHVYSYNYVSFSITSKVSSFHHC